MKKSNRVFIALIGTLYIVPALTFGVAQFTSEKCLTGFTQKFQIIQIDNPELKAENIKVDTRTASEFLGHKYWKQKTGRYSITRERNGICRKSTATILYYWLAGRGTPGKIKISRCISVSTISRRSV